jgi:hypothetical protein
VVLLERQNETAARDVLRHVDPRGRQGKREGPLS